jgi:hypothetical protein
VHIDQHEVHRPRTHNLQGFFAIAGQQRVEPGFEHAAERLAETRVVVGDQQRRLNDHGIGVGRLMRYRKLGSNRRKGPIGGVVASSN